MLDEVAYNPSIASTFTIGELLQDRETAVSYAQQKEDEWKLAAHTVYTLKREIQGLQAEVKMYKYTMDLVSKVLLKPRPHFRNPQKELDCLQHDILWAGGYLCHAGSASQTWAFNSDVRE